MFLLVVVSLILVRPCLNGIQTHEHSPSVAMQNLNTGFLLSPCGITGLTSRHLSCWSLSHYSKAQISQRLVVEADCPGGWGGAAVLVVPPAPCTLALRHPFFNCHCWCLTGPQGDMVSSVSLCLSMENKNLSLVHLGHFQKDITKPRGKTEWK